MPHNLTQTVISEPKINTESLAAADVDAAAARTAAPDIGPNAPRNRGISRCTLVQHAGQIRI